jgi:sec-independent protein translocase protein TatA
MGSFSLWHWLVVGVIILLLFGKGRFSDMMGDVAKGIKSFKKGMSEEEEAAAEEQRRLSSERAAAPPIPPRPTEDLRPASGQTIDARAVDPLSSPPEGERRQP